MHIWCEWKEEILFGEEVEWHRSKGSMKMPFTFGPKQGIGFLFLVNAKLVFSMHH